MGIRPEEVRRVAELARLELREDEVERVAAELTAVLDYATVLRRLDLPARAAEPEAEPGSGLRADEPAPSALDAARALAMAPESADGFFVVPAFVESEEP
jgi:aspartyl-tRNA(Asn)/glutamyl-tRNA(Gln) amidotransferase subunit C